MHATRWPVVAILFAGLAIASVCAQEVHAQQQRTRVDINDKERRYGIGLAPPQGGEEFLEVLMVSPGNVAESAGVLVGDRILSVNGAPVATLNRETFVAAMRGTPLTLVVDRKGETLTFNMSLDGEPSTMTEGGERPESMPGEDCTDAARSLATLLEERYLFPDVGKQYAAMLRQGADAGDYASKTRAAFASQVTADLADVSVDRHLRVLSSEMQMPGAGESGNGPQSYGIADSGWLTEDVAFLRISGMPDVEGGREWTANFMREHAKAKALVIDLRRCPGGSIEMMNGFLSYLYDEPTHLLNMDMRPGADQETEVWFNEISDLRHVKTKEDVLRWEHWIEPSDAPKPQLPVYVLTDFTASACEHLTAALRATDRATIIGATTRGAGHFVAFHEFGDGFTVILPIGRTYDPRTGEGWEGDGIVPDITVDPDDAETEALRRIQGLDK